LHQVDLDRMRAFAQRADVSSTFSRSLDEGALHGEAEEVDP